ncbi:MAG: Holliday junction resolvase RuvX [Akkermansiaceae bacterium]|nr:Holliday junction resolvase RuvX [Akkermansiaceae bacterium]NNM29895.1 Holliday junction resolvase RuvX [Akkermansiaceae bacterium]
MPVSHPVLAIDYGDARIGLAATDDLGIGAHPVETVDVRRTDPLERLAQVVAARGVQTLLLGLPVRMDGSEGSSARKVRAFAAKLTERFPDIPLHLTDERLSTAAAAEKLRAAGKPAKKQKDIIDQAAALELLGDWLREHDPGQP